MGFDCSLVFPMFSNEIKSKNSKIAGSFAANKIEIYQFFSNNCRRIAAKTKLGINPIVFPGYWVGKRWVAQLTLPIFSRKFRFFKIGGGVPNFSTL